MSCLRRGKGRRVEAAFVAAKRLRQLRTWENLMFEAIGTEDDKASEHETQDPKKDRSLPVMFLILPIILFFFVKDRPELVVGVCGSLVGSILAIASSWDLRKRVLFWAVVLAIEAFHVSLAVFVHWPKPPISRLTLLPFGVMYYCLTLGALKLVGRLYGDTQEVE
jgi:hypothetical protein